MKEDRFSRQVLFPPIGRNGQEAIKNKHVLIIGAGALGSSAGEMLTRSGIGALTIVDRDYIEWSNLHRQQLYTENDVIERMPKAIAAEKRLKSIYSDCDIKGIVGEATISMLETILPNVDLIIDATDNFETRMIINDLAVKYNIPWIYGACVGSVGMSFTILPKKTPCLHCLLQRIPIQGMTCDTGGIIAPAVQIVVSHQVAEALKILVEDYEVLRETYLSFDLWNNEFQTIKVSRAKNPDCTTCGENPTYPFLEKSNQTSLAILCGRDTVQIRPSVDKNISLTKVANILEKRGYEVKVNPFLLSVELDENRMVLFKDGRALIHHTKDKVFAKSLYDKLLG